MNQGYFYLCLGKYYIEESCNLVDTIKIHDKIRKHGALVNKEDYDFALSTGRFDVIIINDYSNELYKFEKTSFEKYCLIPRLLFPTFLPFEESIVIDSDVLCIWSMEDVWRIFSNFGQDICMCGYVKDSSWHWGTIDNVSASYGKTIPHTHGGIFYIRKTEKCKQFFKDCIQFFHDYDKYGFLKKFRGGRVDEPIFAISMAKNNMIPVDFVDYRIMTFNLESGCVLPCNIQTEGGRNISCGNNFPLVHMFEKMTGKNYRYVLNEAIKITTTSNPSVDQSTIFG